MTQLPKVVNLKCPNCGGALEIYGDMDRFACGYCGSEQIVERRGGTVGLRLIVDAVSRVQIGTDKTAAELALVRLEKELTSVQARWQEADKLFRLRNKSSSDLAVVGMFFGAFLLMLSFSNIMESLVASVLVAAGAVVTFVWALKHNSKMQKAYEIKRSEFYRPYGDQIQRLEEQISKQRQVVQT